MISRIKNSNVYCYGVNAYMVDTEEERESLTSRCAPGSVVIMSADNSKYRKNNQGEWIVEGEGSGSGSGEGGSGTTYAPGYGILIDSDNKINVDEVEIANVDYVDACISDTMNFIIQERDNEHAGRVAGDNLKQDKLIAGEGISIAEDGKTISVTGGSGGSSDSSIMLIARDIDLDFQKNTEDEYTDTLEDIFQGYIAATAFPRDFLSTPDKYNLIICIYAQESFDGGEIATVGYTANHFCYSKSSGSDNSIYAFCYDALTPLDIEHLTAFMGDTENGFEIQYSGIMGSSTQLPHENGIAKAAIYLQKMY